MSGHRPDVSHHECADCGITAADIDEVDPDYWFESRDGVMRCQGCWAIVEANQRFADGDW